MNANINSRIPTQAPRRPALVFGLLSVVCCLAISGCARPQRSEAAMDVKPEPVCFADMDKEAAMLAAQDVLAKRQRRELQQDRGQPAQHSTNRPIGPAQTR